MTVLRGMRRYAWRKKKPAVCRGLNLETVERLPNQET